MRHSCVARPTPTALPFRDRFRPMSASPSTQTELEAYAFRQLVAHLQDDGADAFIEQAHGVLAHA